MTSPAESQTRLGFTHRARVLTKAASARRAPSILSLTLTLASLELAPRVHLCVLLASRIRVLLHSSGMNLTNGIRLLKQWPGIKKNRFRVGEPCDCSMNAKFGGGGRGGAYPGRRGRAWESVTCMTSGRHRV